jgi:hypothetical protein
MRKAIYRQEYLAMLYHLCALWAFAVKVFLQQSRESNV